MHKMTFQLNISAQNYQSYYSGAAKFVQVQSDDGRSLRFPASELQQFVGHSGIKGRFEIVFDENNKLQCINRL